MKPARPLLLSTRDLCCRDLSGNELQGAVPLAWAAFNAQIRIWLQPGNPDLCGPAPGEFFCALPASCTPTGQDGDTCGCQEIQSEDCPPGTPQAWAPGGSVASQGTTLRVCLCMHVHMMFECMDVASRHQSKSSTKLLSCAARLLHLCLHGGFHLALLPACLPFIPNEHLSLTLSQQGLLCTSQTFLQAQTTWCKRSMSRSTSSASRQATGGPLLLLHSPMCSQTAWT